MNLGSKALVHSGLYIHNGPGPIQACCLVCLQWHSFATIRLSHTNLICETNLFGEVVRVMVPDCSVVSVDRAVLA